MVHFQNSNLILWQYTDSTTNERLLRHHKICRWIMIPCFFCIITSISTTASMLAWGGSTIEFVILIVTGIIGFLLFIPSIFAYAWAGEIEHTLIMRRQPIPSKLSLEMQVPYFALRMMLWFAFMFFVSWLTHRN